MNTTAAPHNAKSASRYPTGDSSPVFNTFVFCAVVWSAVALLLPFVVSAFFATVNSAVAFFSSPLIEDTIATVCFPVARLSKYSAVKVTMVEPSVTV